MKIVSEKINIGIVHQIIVIRKSDINIRIIIIK